MGFVPTQLASPPHAARRRSRSQPASADVLPVWSCGVTLTLLGACTEKAGVRYRVTVEVNDGGRTAKGSGVWETGVIRRAGIFGSAYRVFFRGEAIPVRLANGSHLFYIPAAYPPGGPGDAGELPFRLFSDALSSHNLEPVESVQTLQKLRGQRRSVPCLEYGEPRPQDQNAPNECLMLAYATGLEDPKLFHGIEPGHLKDIGQNTVSIRKVDVQITDEPVTTRLAAMIPWLKGKYDFAGSVDTERLSRLNGPLQLMYLKRQP